MDVSGPDRSQRLRAVRTLRRLNAERRRQKRVWIAVTVVLAMAGSLFAFGLDYYVSSRPPVAPSIQFGIITLKHSDAAIAEANALGAVEVSEEYSTHGAEFDLGFPSSFEGERWQLTVNDQTLAGLSIVTSRSVTQGYCPGTTTCYRFSGVYDPATISIADHAFASWSECHQPYPPLSTTHGFLSIRFRGAVQRPESWARTVAVLPRFIDEENTDASTHGDPRHFVGAKVNLCRFAVGPRGNLTTAQGPTPTLIVANDVYWTEQTASSTVVSATFEAPDAQLLANGTLVFSGFLLGLFATFVPLLRIPSMNAIRRKRRLRVVFDQFRSGAR